MPDPLTIAAIGQTVANPVLQHFSNVKDRKFAREMYNRQRSDAMADWEMQNAYNNPAAQMARFKEAGLNPHLIYGQGSVAQPVRGSSAGGAGGAAPQVETGGILAAQQFAAQKNYLGYQQEWIEQKIKREKAETIKTMSQTDLNNIGIKRGTIKLWLEDQLKETERLTGIQRLLNLQSEGAMKERLNSWQEMLALDGINPLLESIKNQVARRGVDEKQLQVMDANIDKVRKEIELMDEEKKLRGAGTSYRDPLWQRLLMRIVKAIFGDIFN